LDYDEWIAVIKGTVELHHSQNDNDGQVQVLTAHAGETVFVAKGERFRPVFLKLEPSSFPFAFERSNLNDVNKKTRKTLPRCPDCLQVLL
jgi:hypothetical protein